MVNDYEPLIYANLPEFDSAKQALEVFAGLIPTFGEIIKAHDLQKHVGISLLHKHFNLYADEILLRSVEDNAMTTAAVKRSANPAAIPCILAYGKHTTNSPYELYPTEFVASSDASAYCYRALHRIAENKDFIRDMFFAFCDRGVVQYFGIGISPRPMFSISQDEALMENDNLRARKLHIEAMKCQAIDKSKSTQTFWSF